MFIKKKKRNDKACKETRKYGPFTEKKRTPVVTEKAQILDLLDKD